VIKEKEKKRKERKTNAVGHEGDNVTNRDGSRLDLAEGDSASSISVAVENGDTQRSISISVHGLKVVKHLKQRGSSVFPSSIHSFIIINIQNKTKEKENKRTREEEKSTNVYQAPSASR
jgi:hypothetical protein